MDLNKFHIYFQRDNFTLRLSFNHLNLNISIGDFISETVKHVLDKYDREHVYDSNSYGMFECLNGVEKQVSLDIASSLWSLLEVMLNNEHIRYVIRRMSSIELKNDFQVKKTQRQIQKVKKFYQNFNKSKLMLQQQQQQQQRQEQQHKRLVSTSTPRNKFLVVLKNKKRHYQQSFHRIYVNNEMLLAKTIVTTTTNTFATRWTSREIC